MNTLPIRSGPSRSLVRALAAAAAVVALAPVGACTGEQVIHGPGPRAGVAAAPAITHVVLISLVDPSQADALIADCNGTLPKIPDVVFYGCGRPVDIGRTNVDGDYTVGVIIGFDSEAGYARYLDDPQHKRLVDAWRPRWSRARIFDLGGTKSGVVSH
ncbi:MAG: Dabb family protein [Phycisphaerae bacterium]|nr:Dabb family protein [Phycisphaerae bacterium]